MAEEKTDSLFERLKNGEKIICSKCGKGYFIPYNTSANKAHAFNCSNSECGNYLHFDPTINID